METNLISVMSVISVSALPLSAGTVAHSKASPESFGGAFGQE